MLKAYFLSDLHISGKDDPKYKKLLGFLSTLKVSPEVTHLFLLGDIFDLWLGAHSYFIREYQELISLISDLQKKGVNIHYFEGNHDLYLDDFWGKKLGVKIHHGPAIINLGEKTFRLEHGDETNPDDKGYIFLRWFLRTFFMIWFVRLMPEKLVVWIGKKSSEKSRHYTSNVKTIDDSLAKAKFLLHCKNTYLKNRFDLLVAGHIHMDIVEELRPVESSLTKVINLGSWYNKAKVGEFDGAQFVVREI